MIALYLKQQECECCYVLSAKQGAPGMSLCDDVLHYLDVREGGEWKISLQEVAVDDPDKSIYWEDGRYIIAYSEDDTRTLDLIGEDKLIEVLGGCHDRAFSVRIYPIYQEQEA